MPKSEQGEHGGGAGFGSGAPAAPANPSAIAVVVALAAFMKVLDTGIANVRVRLRFPDPPGRS